LRQFREAKFDDFFFSLNDLVHDFFLRQLRSNRSLIGTLLARISAD
jgi:hypothetical protein